MMPTAQQQLTTFALGLTVVLSGLSGCAHLSARVGGESSAGPRLKASESGRDKGALSRVSGLTPAAVDAALAPRKVALLIGVDAYEDPFWSQLLFAGKDAKDLAAVLGDPALGAFDDVVVLSGPGATSREAIERAVDGLAQKAPRPEDTVVVYVSGHGSLAQTPLGAFVRVLIAEDTRHEDLLGTGLTVEAMSARFDALPSRRKVLVLATCHSGGGKGLITPAMQTALASLKGPAPLEAVSRASLVLSASDFGQAAREDDQLKNDVYTHFLIEALREGADANGDGAVSATEAHDYARRRTYEFTQGRQTPAVESSVVGADPVVLTGHRASPGLPVVYSYASGLSGYRLQVDGRDKGGFPGQVVLSEGAHELKLMRAGHETLALGQLQLRDGHRISAESLLENQAPRWNVSLFGGVLMVTSPSLQRQALRPMPRTGLMIERRDFPSRSLHLAADFALGRSEQSFTPASGKAIRQRATEMSLGAALLYADTLGPLQLRIGPHLRFTRLARQILLNDLQEDQSLVTLLPGVASSVGLKLGPWQAQLQAQLHYLPLVLDGKTESTATVVVGLALGRSF